MFFKHVHLSVRLLVFSIWCAAFSNVSSLPYILTVTSCAAFSYASSQPYILTVTSCGAFSSVSSVPYILTVISCAAFSNVSSLPYILTVTSCAAFLKCVLVALHFNGYFVRCFLKMCPRCLTFDGYFVQIMHIIERFHSIALRIVNESSELLQLSLLSVFLSYLDLVMDQCQPGGFSFRLSATCYSMQLCRCKDECNYYLYMQVQYTTMNSKCVYTINIFILFSISQRQVFLCAGACALHLFSL